MRCLSSATFCHLENLEMWRATLYTGNNSVICCMHVISNCVICLSTNVVYGLRV